MISDCFFPLFILNCTFQFLCNLLRWSFGSFFPLPPQHQLCSVLFFLHAYSIFLSFPGPRILHSVEHGDLSVPPAGASVVRKKLPNDLLHELLLRLSLPLFWSITDESLSKCLYINVQVTILSIYLSMKFIKHHFKVTT